MPRRSKNPPGRPSFATDNGVKPGGFKAMVARGKDGGAVVTMLGELDMASAPELERVLNEALGYGGEVEVDMRGCGFMDSTGVAKLVSAARQLSERDSALHVKGAQDRVRRIFELAGLLDNDWIKLEA
jgi:anti-sigma B factor antagonist